jgi:hypothetical protein
MCCATSSHPSVPPDEEARSYGAPCDMLTKEDLVVKCSRSRLIWAVLGGMAFGFLAAVGWEARSDSDAGQESLAVRFARAHVALAETNLKKVLATNRLVAKAVPGNVVAEYRDDLELARLRLEWALRAPAANPFPIWLRSAEASWKAADAEWRSALAANQRMADAVDPLEVERVQRQAEVARLRLELGKTLAGKPAQDQQQWELAFLLDEMQLVKERVLRNPSPGRVYPFWWY